VNRTIAAYSLSQHNDKSQPDINKLNAGFAGAILLSTSRQYTCGMGIHQRLMDNVEHLRSGLKRALLLSAGGVHQSSHPEAVSVAGSLYFDAARQLLDSVNGQVSRPT
jgi:hypothetical protein